MHPPIFLSKNIRGRRVFFGETSLSSINDNDFSFIQLINSIHVPIHFIQFNRFISIIYALKYFIHFITSCILFIPSIHSYMHLFHSRNYSFNLFYLLHSLPFMSFMQFISSISFNLFKNMHICRYVHGYLVPTYVGTNLPLFYKREHCWYFG